MAVLSEDTLQGTQVRNWEDVFQLHSLPFKKVSLTVRDRAPAWEIAAPKALDQRVLQRFTGDPSEAPASLNSNVLQE